MNGLKNWMPRAVVSLSVLGMINAVFLGLLSVKPFSIPVLDSALKICAQIFILDGIFLLIRKWVDRTYGTTNVLAGVADYFSSLAPQFILSFIICFLVILLTGKWWRMEWNSADEHTNDQ